MSDPVTQYAQRRRQIVVILVVSVFAVVIVAMKVAELPAYNRLRAVSDGEALHVIAQRASVLDSPDAFQMTRTTDGTSFDAPSVRGGRLAGIVGDNGTLTMQFVGGSVQRLSRDAWSTSREAPPWPALGVGIVDDNVVVFGQDLDEKIIGVARVSDNGNITFAPGFKIAYEGGRVLSMDSVVASGGRFLVWQEASQAADAEEGEEEETYMLCGGRLEDNTLVSVSRFALDGRTEYTVTSGASGPEVYCGVTLAGGGLFASAGSSLRRLALTDEGWKEAPKVSLPQKRWRRTGATTVARFKGRTRIYACTYWLGMLYAGVYGVEQRGDGFSDWFEVTQPTPAELDTEVSWLLQSMMACFVAAGALGGLARVRTFERTPPPLAETPVYASVSDRAAAAGFDYLLVYLIMHLTSQGMGPLEFWSSFVFMHALYGVASETLSRGQTLGKRLLGLRVMTTGGGPVLFGHALQRNVLKFFEMLTVGTGVCLMSRRYQRPGDFLAGTVVIKELRMPKPAEE